MKTFRQKEHGYCKLTANFHSNDPLLPADYCQFSQVQHKAGRAASVNNSETSVILHKKQTGSCTRVGRRRSGGDAVRTCGSQRNGHSRPPHELKPRLPPARARFRQCGGARWRCGSAAARGPWSLQLVDGLLLFFSGEPLPLANFMIRPTPSSPIIVCAICCAARRKKISCC